jgi:hypothetical protein
VKEKDEKDKRKQRLVLKPIVTETQAEIAFETA